MDDKTHIILCGGVPLPAKYKKQSKSHIHKFTYDTAKKEQNVNLELPHFIKQVNFHFQNRTKDLLEIAGYVYATDRMIKRGKSDQVEYQSWSRKFHFFIKVRDYQFWKKIKVAEQLNALLSFVSGDASFQFTFLEGGKDIGQANLFDNADIELEKRKNTSIALFSGGLDSLAGALEILNTTEKNLILISHHSNNFAVTQIQKNVYELLKRDYPSRVQRFPFSCSLHGERAAEETQRTRIFLYTCIAYSLLPLIDEKEINVFENGMTSINFSKRQDMMNARASRTTHPKTINLLETLFSTISSKPVKINHPFFTLTKTDVFNKIKQYGKIDYLNSTITCTKTFNVSKKESPSTHCGECSQCIDRRFASIAAGLEDYDVIYDSDIRKDSTKEEEGYTHLCDYVSLAFKLSQLSEFQFQYDLLDILPEIIPFIDGRTEHDKLKTVYDLTQRHCSQIFSALKIIRANENILLPKKPRTLFTFLDDRIHLKPLVERLVEKICSKLSAALPIAFERKKPTHENELNDQINALIVSEESDYKREYPSLKFSFARTVPDHAFLNFELLIEAKLLKKETSKSSITNQISADMIKYGASNKLFLLYDPERRIVDEKDFKKDFLNHHGTYIHIIR